MAKVVEAQSPQAAWVTLDKRALMGVAAIGACVGLISYAIFVVLTQLVFEPLLCRDATALVSCESRDGLAGGMALLIGSVVGLVFLVRERVFRPLLVVLGVALALSGVFTFMVLIPWYLAVVIAAATFGVAYILFTWLSQPTNLIVALTTVTITVVLARLILTN